MFILKINEIACPDPKGIKQWREFNKKKASRVLDGRTWDDMPVIEG
jgi:protein gp37